MEVPYQGDPSIRLGSALPTVPGCARRDYPMDNYHINGLAFSCIRAVQTPHVLFSPCQYLRAGTSTSCTVPGAVHISSCGANASAVTNTLLSPHHHPFGRGHGDAVITQYLLKYNWDFFPFNLTIGRGRTETRSLRIHASLLQHHCQEMVRFLCVPRLVTQEN